MRENERKRKIIEYLKKNVRKGYTTDALKYALLNQGYSRVELDFCIEQFQKEMAETAPILKEKPKITYQILDSDDNLITIKKPWWKRLFA